MLLTGFLIGLLIVLFVGILAGLFTLVNATQFVLLVVGVALIVAALARTRTARRLWCWLDRQTDKVLAASDDGNIAGRQLLWLLPFGVMSVAGAVVFGVLAIMTLWDVPFSDLVPWLFVLAAGTLLVLALIAVSFAPPGPNWVRKIAGIPGGTLLMMVGVVLVIVGTYQWFGFPDDGSEPSDWWLIVVIAGLLIGLVGISRPVRPVDPPPPAAATARRAVADAARLADAASRHAQIAERQKTKLDALDVADPAVTRFAAAARRGADAAEESATSAGERADEAFGAEWMLYERVDDAFDDVRSAQRSAAAARRARLDAISARRKAEEQQQ